MDKITVAPKIIVYKNMLKNPKNTLDFLKSTEAYTEKTGLFEPWRNWEANWFGKITEIMTDGVLYEINDFDDEELKKQKIVLNEIRNVYIDVLNDYASIYKNDTDWPDFIKSWDNFPNEPWVYIKEIGILKYNSEQNEDMANYPLAMHYHTDYNSSDAESRSSKLVITVTMYLNDDYEGGEISLYDPNSNSVYNYKPKAGDVTVFPSGMNYYHGVLPFQGNNRYLIRMIMLYYYEGSEKWLRNEKEYGPDLWKKMEKERLEKAYHDCINITNIVLPGQTEQNPNFKSIYVKKDPIYIDGTKNDK